MLILVGRVAGAFGVRGEMRLVAYTGDPLALLRYRDLKRADGAAVLTLESARVAKANELVIRAREVATREAAEALRGTQLFVPRAALPATEDEDEFYLADLIGLEARSREGAALGRVKAVHNHGAGDILEIEPPDGARSRLYPFTREVVPALHLTQGWLQLEPPHELDDASPDSPDG